MSRLNTVTLVALIVAYALGPLATQIITPAVPFVHRDLGVPMSTAQALISLAFVAIAAATLVYGPLSDRYGRRPVILLGTLLFCIGSLLAATAPGAGWLLAGRVLQSAGSAAALSLTRTVIHDVYGRQHSGRILAQLTTVMVFVPMLAPMLGGALIDHVGWRAVFGVCFVFGIVALSLLSLHLTESRPASSRAPRIRDAIASYRDLLADPEYRAPALHFAWVMAAVFATQAAVPYLLVEVLGGTATEYGLWFGLACVAYVAGNQFTARWGHRFEPRQLIRASSLGCIVVAVAGTLASHVFELSALVLFVPMIALYFFAAVGIAPVQAEAVAAQPDRAGAASGLLSAVQMIVGAVTVQAIGYSHDGTAHPLFLGLVFCSVAAFACFVARRPAPVDWQCEEGAWPNR
ncbi:MAG TPA: multidrug effflux MFS transporter [Steroidobacteraceae bacterium]